MKLKNTLYVVFLLGLFPPIFTGFSVLNSDSPQDFKNPVDFFYEIQSYSANSYTCPAGITLQKALEKVSAVSPVIKGDFTAQKVFEACKRGNFFVIPPKQMSKSLLDCTGRLKALFEQHSVPQLAYTDETLLAECLVQNDFRGRNNGPESTAIIAANTNEIISRIKQDYYSCAHVPIEEGTSFSCAEYLAEQEMNAKGVVGHEE